jgi:hypothetical protein
MQKIMFNDRCALTYAVIDEIKNNTRRIEGGKQFQLAATAAEDFTYEEATGCIVMCCQGIEIFRHKCRYKVGEIVAVAQSYEQVYRQGNMDADDAIIRGLKYDPGMCNKMYVRAALMPHQIRIMGIRCERLQDISDEDCMREGVRQFTPDFPKDFPIHPTHFIVGNILKNTPREAFAALIDKVSGRGTWGRNPWVVAYEFELVK